MASLTLENVDKIYGEHSRRAVPAVSQLNLTINDGEIVGLLGSSGCGKTSTLRMIAGLETISDGEIRIGERMINKLRAAQRNVAMAFEGYALYPPLKVRDNIAFSLLRDKTPKTEIEDKVRGIAKLLDIESILDRYPPNLSGGQQQRVSLARSLVRSADVHLLDEPMSQLEPQLRAILRARVKEYLIRHRLTTVFVTHDQTEAIALADRIAVMEEGELQQFASPDELRDRPANLFVASFIGEPPMNILKGRVTSADTAIRFKVSHDNNDAGPILTLPSAGSDQARTVFQPERPLYLGIRPQKIRLPAEQGGSAITLQGEVISNQWLGDQTHVGIDIQGSFLIVVSDGDIEAPLGSRMTVGIALEALHVFDASDSGKGVALLHGMGRD